MKTTLTVLGIIALCFGIGALISLIIQKVTGRNLQRITKLFFLLFLLTLVGMALVFAWYVLLQ
jgi:preprotein translocase subunit SecG